jgi:spore maturation protein CgeB
MKLLIIGFTQQGHMAGYLANAARQLRLDHETIDVRLADAKTRIVQRFYWRLCDKRPAHLERFARSVIETCRIHRPDIAVTTGRTPLTATHIAEMRALGTKVINYSTDDPWNAKQKASWFLSTLPFYDVVFTPRRSNLEQFRRIGVKQLYYLPFAYDPEIHKPSSRNERSAKACDLLFVGGCDPDRLPLMKELIRAGFDVALLGGYWDRDAETRAFARGIVDQKEIRALSASAKISLCLVRRANRDEHVMRSYEAAAIGGCIIAEDTNDHRILFGDAVSYFRSSDELIVLARSLIADPEARRSLAARLRDRFMDNRETYAHRLLNMIEVSLKSQSSQLPQQNRLAFAGAHNREWQSSLKGGPRGQTRA